MWVQIRQIWYIEKHGNIGTLENVYGTVCEGSWQCGKCYGTLNSVFKKSGGKKQNKKQWEQYKKFDGIAVNDMVML